MWVERPLLGLNRRIQPRRTGYIQLVSNLSSFGSGLVLTGVALAALGVLLQPIRPMVVVGRSMAPTYADRSILLTQPVDRPLRHGDVVVVQTPTGPIIKRVALLAGDLRYQWHCAEGWMDLTGVALPKSKLHDPRFRIIRVPEGTVFLLGDNLEISTDSRTFGPVAQADVIRLIVDQREPDLRADVHNPLTQNWLVLGSSRRIRKG